MQINQVHKKAFETFMANPSWRAFYKYIQSEAFIDWVVKLFPEAREETYTRRFEFSFIPANGGNITPHTDVSNKAYTLCIYMPTEDWDTNYGGDFQGSKTQNRR